MTIFATTARAVGAAGMLCLVAGAPAWANTLDDLETILNSYNLVTSGDVSGKVHTEGRAYIGGNVISSQKLGFYNNPDDTESPWAELIVQGDIIGDKYHQILNGGDAWIGGNVENLDGGTGTAYVNGQVTGTSHMNAVENAGITIPDLYDGFAGFGGLSAQLANQAPTDVVNASDSQRPRFTANSPVNGVSIFDISSNMLSSGDNLKIIPNSADLVVVNVSGTNVNFGLNNITDMSFADNILWNFYEAETLDVGRAWVGSVLAPNAHVNLNQNIDGSLVAASINLVAELHPKGFSGDFDFLDPDGGVSAPAVPAPAAAPLLVFGLGAFAGLRRLRRKG